MSELSQKHALDALKNIRLVTVNLPTEGVAIRRETMDNLSRYSARNASVLGYYGGTQFLSIPNNLFRFAETSSLIL